VAVEPLHVALRFRRVVVAASVLASVLAIGAASPAVAAESTIATAGWLHVDHRGSGLPVVRDEAGRQVLLRGTNIVGIQDGYYEPRTDDAAWTRPMWPVDPDAYAGTCPTNDRTRSDPPLCEVDAGAPAEAQSGAFDSRNDFAQMRAFGFDHVRLTISWSQLEPSPGVYSTRYLDRIAQVVGWAGEQGIHVLLDMHQDNWSRFLVDTSPVEVPGVLTSVKAGAHHADGAPAWAILTDGMPSLAPFGTDAFNAAMNAAFTSFWENRPVPAAQGDSPGTGLQDHYIGAMAALARRFVDEPVVSGYEIMNEPQSGSIAAPGGFEAGVLLPFYRRVIDAITGVADGAPCPASIPATPACGYPDLGVHDTRHLFFFEPWALRNLLDASPQTSVPFSTYPNLVYAPHTYTREFTVDRTLFGPSPVPVPYPVDYDQAFTTAEAEATALGAALFIGEFGNGSGDDDTLLRESTAAQDRHLAGAAVWEWKGNCGAGSTSDGCRGAWSTFEGDAADPPAQNLEPKPTRLRYIDRPYPRRTAGDLLSIENDPDALSFAMTATAATAVARGDRPRETELVLPSTRSGDVVVSGAAVLDRVEATVDGDRVAWVAPTGDGAYRIDVSAADPVVPETSMPAAAAAVVALAGLVGVFRRRRRAL
jgi:endoglycosylceramidase